MVIASEPKEQRSKRIPVRPEPHNVDAISPFQNDALSREKFVRGLADIIEVSEGPYVVALDSAWGTGKSVTLTMLQAVLANKEHPVVMFNAWTADHCSDPLVALAAEFIGQTRTKLPLNQKLKKGAKAMTTAVQKLAKPLLTAAVKAGAGGLLDLASLESSFKQPAQDVAVATAESLVDRYLAEKDAMEVFRIELARWTAMASEKGRSVVILVDELDRCRPTFAIELLERIKHLFDVTGLVFVIAVHREELAHSVRAIYGNDFGAAQYLNRFFDLECRLPKASNQTLLANRISALGLDPYFDRRLDPGLKQDLRLAVLRITQQQRWSPRQALAFLGRLALVLLQRTPETAPPVALVVGLLVLRELRPDNLASLRNRDLEAGTAGTFLQTVVGDEPPVASIRVAVEVWVAMHRYKSAHLFDIRDMADRQRDGTASLYMAYYEAYRPPTCQFDQVMALLEFAT